MNVPQPFGYIQQSQIGYPNQLDAKQICTI